jgi:hypothetical protein
LGHQEKHWKAGKSAHALTNLWFRTESLPDSVASILRPHPIFGSAELIDAFLERKTNLGTRGRASQTDLLGIIGADEYIAVLAVEAKAGETFGERVCQWHDGSEGKRTRLAGLCKTLCIPEDVALQLRYQLLHRAVSAIYEAKRYRTNLAIVLVQSFARDDESFGDFEAFSRAIGITDETSKGTLSAPVVLEGVSLYLAWIDEQPIADSGYLVKLQRYADELSRYSDRLRAWCNNKT